MNHALKLALLLHFFIGLCSSALSAQPYDEGQYGFRFLSLEQLQPLDSAVVGTMEREMSKFSTGIAYRDSQIVLIAFDRLGEILVRTVILPYEQRAFNLEYREIGAVYDTSAWNKANSAFNLTKMMVGGMAVDSVGPKVHKVMGFDCRYVRFSPGRGNYIDTYMTDQISYPRLEQEPESEADVFDTLTLVKIEAEITGEFIMHFGIDTFYTEVKNPEWFSTEPPSGAMTSEELEKAGQSIKETLESIGGDPEKGQGANLDLVARLNELGLIRDYEYADRVKRQRSTDRLTLITTAISNYEATKWDSLIHVLEQTEILMPEEAADLRGKIAKIPVLEKKRFEDLVTIWMLKGMLADPTHRQMLVRNLEQLDCYDIDDDIRSKGAAFVKGELSLMQYIFSMPQFKPLPRQGTRQHKDQLPEIISYLIASAIPELKEEIKIEPMQAEGELYYMVRTTDEVYRLPTEAFEPDANSAANTDSILIDKAVYDPIINIIKQIIADKGLKRVCSVVSLADRLPRFVNQKEYDWVITQQPDLKLFDQPYYLNVYPEGKYDWLICDIPISFPLEQDQALQATFRDFMSGDFSGHLPSAAKRKFIAFLRQEQQDLGMTTANIDVLEDELMGRLVLNIQYYIKAIPNIHITLGIFNEWPAALLEGQPDFKDAFPQLHRLLDGAVKVGNLRPDASGKALILMDVNGKTVKVKAKRSYAHPEKEGLMQAIQPFLAEKKMGIFTFNTLMKERTYYLLTYEQRKALEEILGLRFVRV
jgi:hypothetical protein